MSHKTRATQRQVASGLRSDGKTWVEIAYILQARWPELNSRSAMRVAHAWSQGQAAEAWNRFWPENPKTATEIGLWELRRPGFATLDKLARLYECSVSDLVADLGDYRHRDPAHGRGGSGGVARSLIAEWRTAEDRLVGHWSEHFDGQGPAVSSDPRAQALAFWQLAGLYATTDVGADVLADVVMRVQLHGLWETLEAGADQPEGLLTERGQALLVALRGIMARQVGRLDEADRLLSEALAVPAFTGTMARLAQYYLAETRDIHEGDPIPLLLGLAQVDDRIGTEARIAYAHALIRLGDLPGALMVAEEFAVDSEDPEFRYRLHELVGHLWLCAGAFATAAEHFEISRQVAESQRSLLLEALGLRHLVLTRCWTEPRAVLGQVDEAERLNRHLNLHPGIGQCLVARAVAMAGQAPLADVDVLLAEADAVFTEAGYFDDALAAPAVAVFAAAASGDDELALRRRAAAIERARGRRSRTWLAAVDIWTGGHEHADTVVWPQGRDEAIRAWSAPLQLRRPESSALAG